MLVAAREYLGPADVIGCEGDHVRLTIDGRTVRARLAFAFFYEPVPGDTLLAIGSGDDFYAIGVLRGSGSVRIDSPSGLELRAGRGTIEIISAQRVRVSAPEVSLRASRLEFLARTLRERSGSVRRWVRGLIEIKAGALRTRVEGDSDLKAGRITERATDEVIIDGRSIHLG